MHQYFIIAIDGPAASGKGTLARKIATTCKLPHLDTGLTYRAVAHQLITWGHDFKSTPFDDEEMALKAAQTLDLAALDRDLLSQHAIGEAASQVAIMPKLRHVLVALQRQFATTPPGAVLDGRDIGTIVCPDAQVKLYITASPRERARRRWSEMQLKGQSATFDDILHDIVKRDERDMARKESPLRPAENAHLIDTTEMDIESAFIKAMDIVNAIRQP